MDNYPNQELQVMPQPKPYRLMTDDEIVRLIDEGHYNSIGKLERTVGAGKNQLRNRYNKVKNNLSQPQRCHGMGRTP